MRNGGRLRGLPHIVSILSIILVTSSSLLFSQTKYFLSSDGSDRQPGTFKKPFATFTRASETLRPGDTLVVRGGVYREWFTLGGSDGTPEHPIVIMAQPGETPIIDGENILPPVEYAGLVNVYRKYYHVIGLEVRNSAAIGVRLMKTGSRVTGLNVHNCWSAGIYAGGDSSIVEDCLVHDVSMNNVNGQAYVGGRDWAPGITAARGGEEPEKDHVTDYAIIRRNICYDSWGEGISTYEARHTLMEDNVVYDAWAATFYISDAAYVVARRNLIYGTYAMPNRTGGESRSVGLYIGNERYTVPSVCDTVYGNIVYNTARCLYIAHPVPGSLLANNTFVNSTLEATIRLSEPSTWQVVNNIVEQDDDLPLVTFRVTDGPTFSHNLWSKKPHPAAAGAGDVIGDPRLARDGGTGAGQLRWNFFVPASASPALRNGTSVELPDHGAPQPDMGAVVAGKLIGGR